MTETYRSKRVESAEYVSSCFFKYPQPTHDFSSSSPQTSRDITAYNGFEYTIQFKQFKCQNCCENSTMKRTPGQMGIITAPQLYDKLERARNLNTNVDFILVDARDCAAYCSSHIITSINFNCHSKIMAKRAVKLWSEMFIDYNQCPAPIPISRSESFSGQSHVESPKNLHSVKSCADCNTECGQSAPTYSSVIIYTEDGEQISAHFQGAPSTAIPPLHLFINHLLENSNNVFFLQGGYKSFTRMPRDLKEFIDSGTNIGFQTVNPQEEFQSFCKPQPVIEPLVNFISVSAASTQASTMSHKTPELKQVDASVAEIVKNKPKLQLSATFPPKSIPMSKLLIPHMIIKTPKLDQNSEDGPKTGSKSHHGSDIFSAVISQILPHLYLGNARDAQNKNLLEQLGITHILNVTDCVPTPWESNFVYMRLSALDDDRQNLKSQFDEAFRFIEEAIQSGGTVLVHCQAGVSRSVTIVIAYMLRRDRSLTLMEALDKVQNVRPIAGPNLNFMGQLQSYQRELKARSLDGQSTPMDIDEPFVCSAGGSSFRRGHSRTGSNGSNHSMARSGSHESLVGVSVKMYLARDTETIDSPRASMSPLSSEDAITPPGTQ